MDIVIMIVITALILGALVFIHEGGHFLVARAFGVRVSEFMIGLPGPSIGVTIKGTRFGVTAVPLGGYANVCGMGTGPESPYLEQVLTLVHKEGTVVLEDVASYLGISEDDAYQALEELSEWGSIARPHRKDRINVYRTLPADGIAEGQPQPLDDPEAFFEKERAQQYRSLPFFKRILILLAGPLMNLLFAILAFVIIYSAIGVDLQNTTTGQIVHYTLSPLDAVIAGFQYIGAVFMAIIGLFNPATAAQTVSNSTSIVGIAVLSKSAFEAGFASLLSFSAVISVSLGLMNLLPIPPLDGGRFVIEVFQKIARRDVSIRAMNYMSMAGMFLFFAFFFFMLNQDVQRFIFGNWG